MMRLISSMGMVSIPPRLTIDRGTARGVQRVCIIRDLSTSVARVSSPFSLAHCAGVLPWNNNDAFAPRDRSSATNSGEATL